MRLLLLALTGMGNHVLESLLTWPRLSSVAVISRHEPGPYPHSRCGHLGVLCASKGILCRTDLDLDSPEAMEHVADFSPDVLLCATFHQLVPAKMLRLARVCAINIHSSLLPAYRGPTPTNWAILRGEEQTGVSFHQLTEGVDQGGIYALRSLAVGERTDGELRLALAELAGREVCGLLDQVIDGQLSPAPQDEAKSFWLPKVGSDAGLGILLRERPPRDRLLRGLTPMPGPDFLARVLRGLDEPA